MTTTKQFDPKTADLLTFNRKLKAIASQKTHAKQKGDQTKYDQLSEEYTKIAALKAQKFPTKRSHSFKDYTDSEIEAADLDTTVRAIKSLQSLICVYPHRIQELNPIKAKFINHRTTLQAQLKLQELQAQLNN